MKRFFYSILALTFLVTSPACSKDENVAEPINDDPVPEIRVPAEFEPHAATWVQWADDYGLDVLEAFANFVKVVQQYEPVHFIIDSELTKEEIIQFLNEKGVTDNNITYHVFPIDYSWMRDNGPIYVTNGTKTWIQNWKFNGWGGGFGNFPSPNDNKIPAKVAEYLGLEVEDYLDYVLEKGNVEVNGKGILAINWDCQAHRNPGLTKEQHEAILKKALGATKILWSYGHYPEDGTIGHIDGMARFIDENTIVVVEESAIEDNFAKTCQDAGLEVLRFSGSVNWLVGNGFVVAMGEEGNNDALKSQLESFFPDRDIYMIDAEAIGKQGGGIHCVTNDQPVLP